jgi:hypothetical protein
MLHLVYHLICTVLCCRRSRCILQCDEAIYLSFTPRATRCGQLPELRNHPFLSFTPRATRCGQLPELRSHPFCMARTPIQEPYPSVSTRTRRSHVKWTLKGRLPIDGSTIILWNVLFVSILAQWARHPDYTHSAPTTFRPGCCYFTTFPWARRLLACR